MGTRHPYLEHQPRTLVVKNQIDGNYGEGTGRGGDPNPMACVQSRAGIVILIAYFVLSSGSIAFLLNRFLSIPGLDGQIARLENQVSLLDSEIVDLKTQVTNLGNQVSYDCKLFIQNQRIPLT